MAGKMTGTSGKSETFIKLGLVFFISLLSFAIGTLVGKEYSDRQYKLSKLEPTEHHDTSKREVASLDHGVNKLSDEEIAKLAEEFVTDDTVESAKEGHAEVPAIEKRILASKSEEFEEMNDAALEAAQALIDGRHESGHGEKDTGHTRKVAATETTKPSLPHSMPKNAAQDSVGKYTIQVGAYLKEEDAKNRTQGLKAKGYNAFYIPGVVDGKTWYRVNVGTYATLDEAKRANDKYIADNAGQKGFIKVIQ